MDIYALLKQDHEKVKELLNKLDETGDGAVKTREKLFAQLKQELTVHSEAEEKTFYDALKEAEETHEIVLEGVEEHHVASALLTELDAMPKDDERWGAKLSVLKENVTHHIEEEEKELFKKARKVLDAAQAEEIAKRMEAEKRALLAQV